MFTAYVPQSIMGTVVPKLEHEAKIRLGILIAVTKCFYFFIFFMYDDDDV